jgi:predicted RNase H-like nuclease (RuvC/YqgF family)
MKISITQMHPSMLTNTTVRHTVQQRGLIMSGTNQLEMKLHEQNEKISKLNHEVERLKAIVENLCERLMVQG